MIHWTPEIKTILQFKRAKAALYAEIVERFPTGKKLIWDVGDLKGRECEIDWVSVDWSESPPGVSLIVKTVRKRGEGITTSNLRKYD